MLKMDGYDDCIVGVVERYGMSPVICYDYQKVIVKLINDGMTYEEADEWYNYNMIGSYVGEETPCFLRLCGIDEINLIEEFDEVP